MFGAALEHLGIGCLQDSEHLAEQIQGLSIVQPVQIHAHGDPVQPSDHVAAVRSRTGRFLANPFRNRRGMTLFHGWAAKPVAADDGVGFIRNQLITVEAYTATVATWTKSTTGAAR